MPLETVMNNRLLSPLLPSFYYLLLNTSLPLTQFIFSRNGVNPHKSLKRENRPQRRHEGTFSQSTISQILQTLWRTWATVVDLPALRPYQSTNAHHPLPLYPTSRRATL